LPIRQSRNRKPPSLGEVRKNTKHRELEAAGFFVGQRDPQRNRVFKGSLMICANLNVGPTDCAKTGGYCITGDNLARLIETAHDANFT
jgi:hypothetical protein